MTRTFRRLTDGALALEVVLSQPVRFRRVDGEMRVMGKSAFLATHYEVQS